MPLGLKVSASSGVYQDCCAKDTIYESLTYKNVIIQDFVTDVPIFKTMKANKCLCYRNFALLVSIAFLPFWGKIHSLQRLPVILCF